jgi:hypothetical protein
MRLPALRKPKREISTVVLSDAGITFITPSDCEAGITDSKCAALNCLVAVGQQCSVF